MDPGGDDDEPLSNTFCRLRARSTGPTGPVVRNEQ
jgi:hypothetical protein